MKKEEALIKLNGNKYYILASSSYADDRTRVLNSGDAFAIFDRWGDIKQLGNGVQGIYYQGTRFVSDMELELNHYRPLLLSSTIKMENDLLSVDLTNPDMEEADHSIPKGSLHIARTKFLQGNRAYEQIVLNNFGEEKFDVRLGLSFQADFRDIFEVRGVRRDRRGRFLKARKEGGHSIHLAYEGLDNVKRTTSIRFQPRPDHMQDQAVLYEVSLKPGESFRIRYTMIFSVGEVDASFDSYSVALKRARYALDARKEKVAHIYTSNEQFNNWINRSKQDLVSLVIETPEGDYPYAGIPWYNTVFGRDGLITALETLWIAPDVARGVLRFLAAHQAHEMSPLQDAEPGKILHEMRHGEMAATGEIPFRLYYGSIDTTPLFLVLAGQYLRRTGDLVTIREIWDNLKSALEWIDVYGDVDGDGFVEYQRKAESGLANQGWKDSFDSISHASGELADYPVALCEVQGYVYEAKLQAAYLARALGQEDFAERLEQEAEWLKTRFNEAFWDEEMSCFVLALDAKKQPCRVLASNAGHCLFNGIATPDKAYRTGKSLMSASMFNGWGIRTLSSREARYNPMSYHNGSVWPHDTALVAAGLARYGMMKEAVRLTQALFDASLFVELQRLPELFCGFSFRRGEAPTSYPVACSPQAWSVASVYLLLQACLQINIDGMARRIIFRQPMLPDFLKEVRISGLRCGEALVELKVFRHEREYGIHAIKMPAGWEVVYR